MINPSIAVIVLTFNEEANLDRALASVCGWAREIFVVDSYSSDRTVDIALARSSEGVAVVQHSFADYSTQWNWALTHLPISAEWTLKLDADEQVTEEFKSEVAALAKGHDGELEGVLFRRRLVFCGSAIKWGGVLENYDLRMWRTGRATFETRSVNEHAIVHGSTLQLRSFVLHHDFKALSSWIDKHNRYSSLEANNILSGNVTGNIAPRFFGSPAERRMWLRTLYYRLPMRPLLYFLYRFIFRLGFLDGKAGFRYAFLNASFLYWIELKMREYRNTGNLPEVIWPARGNAHPAVASSDLQRMVDSQERVIPHSLYIR